MTKAKKIKRIDSVLGRNIVRQRDALGYNQERFAHEADIGISSLKDIERGVSEGSRANREKIAKFIGCTVDELFSSDQPPKAQHGLLTAKDAADFLSTFAGLPPKAQRYAIALVYGDKDILSALPAEVSSVFPSASKAKQNRS